MKHAQQHEKQNDYLNRFAQLIKKIGGNAAAAQIMDKSVKSVERYKAGAEAPFDAVTALAEAADASLDWLATGEGVLEKTLNKQGSESFEKSLYDEILVKLYGLAKKHKIKVDGEDMVDLATSIYDAELKAYQEKAENYEINEGQLDLLFRAMFKAA